MLNKSLVLFFYILVKIVSKFQPSLKSIATKIVGPCTASDTSGPAISQVCTVTRYCYWCRETISA
jgi:hypothetical protein